MDPTPERHGDSGGFSCGCRHWRCKSQEQHDRRIQRLSARLQRIIATGRTFDNDLDIASEEDEEQEKQDDEDEDEGEDLRDWVPPSAPPPSVPEGWEKVDNYTPPVRIGFDPEVRGETLTVTYFKRKKRPNEPDDERVFAHMCHGFWDKFPALPTLRDRATRRNCERSKFILEILTEDREYRDWKYYDLCPRESDSHGVYIRFSLDAVPVPGSGSNGSGSIGDSSRRGDLTVLCPLHAPRNDLASPKSHNICAIGPRGKAWGHRKFEIQDASSRFVDDGDFTSTRNVSEFIQSNTFTTARGWLDQCCSDPSHVSCRKDDDDFLPSRLLNISHGINGLKIEEHGQLQGAKSYVALSYCWGLPQLSNSNNHTSDTRGYFTTQDNLELRKQGFSGHVDGLPRTLLDAVAIARAFGFKHIWIDSLCILQDDGSRDDWEREARQMCKIYGRSDLTIVAGEPVDVSEGFVTVPNRPLVNGSILIFGQKLLVRSSTPVSAIQPCPRYRWKSRGWAMQEEALSNRILYFIEDAGSIWARSDNKRELLLEFECHRHHVRVEGSGKRTSALSSAIRPWIQHQKRLNHNDIEWIWRETIENYSSRTLTKESDILPALEGVAREISRSIANLPDSTTPKYFAGLWSPYILLDLCWTVATKEELKDRGDGVVWAPDPARRQGNPAPSWSWASLEVAHGVRWDQTLKKYGYETLGSVCLDDNGGRYLGQETSNSSMRQAAFITLTDCKLLPGHKVTTKLSHRDCWVLFLVCGEDRDEDGERWNVYHGIVLEWSYRERFYTRIGSISVGLVEKVAQLLESYDLGADSRTLIL